MDKCTKCEKRNAEAEDYLCYDCRFGISKTSKAPKNSRETTDISSPFRSLAGRLRNVGAMSQVKILAALVSYKEASGWDNDPEGEAAFQAAVHDINVDILPSEVI